MIVFVDFLGNKDERRKTFNITTTTWGKIIQSMEVSEVDVSEVDGDGKQT